MVVGVDQRLAIWSPRPNAVRDIVLAESVTIHGLPLLDIVPIHLTEQQLVQLEQASVWLFISQYAVTELFNNHTAMIDMARQRSMVAIGEKTAATLSDYELSASIIAPSPFTSEALLADQAFLDLDYQSIALVCGLSGRQLLQQQLASKGKAVYRISCYKRDKCKLSQEVMLKFVRKHQINAIIISSCAVADAVMLNITLLASDKRYLGWPVFVLSHRIGEYVSTIGFKQVIVAKNASQQSLHHSILTWWESQQK